MRIYMYMYIYIYIEIGLSKSNEARSAPKPGFIQSPAPKGGSEKGDPDNHALRPVRLLRVWVSEGLTQANS